jgi:hypothetical protein
MPECIRRTTAPEGRVSLSGGFMSPLSARFLSRRNADEFAAKHRATADAPAAFQELV